MPRHPIEAELTKATRFKSATKERLVYLAGLAKTAYDLHGDEWDKLSKSAQDWVNDVVTTNDVRDFDEAKPKLKKKANGSAGHHQTAKETAKPKAAEKVESYNSTEMIMNALIDNPKASRDDVREQLKKDGYNPSPDVVAHFLSHFRTAIRVLQKRGKLKANLL